MKFDKYIIGMTLMYVTFWEPTKGYINNLAHLMLALDCSYMDTVQDMHTLWSPLVVWALMNRNFPYLVQVPFSCCKLFGK